MGGGYSLVRVVGAAPKSSCQWGCLARRGRFGLAMSLLATLVALPGCGGADRAASSDSTALHDAPSADEIAARRLRPAGNYVYQHDFGVVPAGPVVRHVFMVPNEGASRLTIRHIGESCVCTAARVSRPFIEPGGTVEIEVKYRTPRKSGDTRAHVTLLFAEPGASPAFLVVSAKVREPMTIFRDAVMIPGLGTGQRATDRFDVENYSGEDWASVGAKTDAPWARAACRLLSRKAPAEGVRQVWEAAVDVDAAGLRPGRYRTDVEVSVKTAARDLRRRVPVDVVVSSPVEAIPSEAFFGVVKANHPVERRLVIRFADAAKAPDVAAATWSHDLGTRLQVSCRTTSARFWEATVRLSPGGVTGILSGTIHLSFPDGGLPGVEIPVRAMVREEQTAGVSTGLHSRTGS